MSRVISPAGLRFIGGWEGFRGHLYNDPLGHCTIGYGHLVHHGQCNGSEPERFKLGLTREQGLDLLRNDVSRYAAGVTSGVRVRLNQQQFDSLVSFTYNVGTGGFASSTLLRKLNKGDYSSVPSELMRWTNNGLPGLVRRRRAEGILFRDGRYAAMNKADEESSARALEKGIIGGPEQRRDAEIHEATAGLDEPAPAGAEGPADEGQHASAGENPVDIGEPTDQSDDPPPNEKGALSEADRLPQAMAIALDMGLVITSTTGPGHGANSYHYRRPYRNVVIRGRRYELGRAADAAKAGNPDRLYRRYFKRIERMKPTELFYDPMGYSWKDGKKVSWVPGDHRDHVHVAF